ncbi:MAG: hypothetical protein NVSMB25_19740 [Thermoleophilaceae bacterium]
MLHHAARDLRIAVYAAHGDPHTPSEPCGPERAAPGRPNLLASVVAFGRIARLSGIALLASVARLCGITLAERSEDASLVGTRAVELDQHIASGRARPDALDAVELREPALERRPIAP